MPLDSAHRRTPDGYGDPKHSGGFLPFLTGFLSKKSSRGPRHKPQPPVPHREHLPRMTSYLDHGSFFPPPSMPDYGNPPLRHVFDGMGHGEAYGKSGPSTRESEIAPQLISGKPVQRVHEDLESRRKSSLLKAGQKETAIQTRAAVFNENKERQLRDDVELSMHTQSMPESLKKIDHQAGQDLHVKDSFSRQVYDDVDHVETVRKLDLYARKDIPSGSIPGDGSDHTKEYASPSYMFLCALCDRVMEDPVVIVSGQTYDRTCFEKWLKEGNNICPKTKHRLVHFNHAPNLALKDLISLHSSSHGIFQSPPPQSFLCFLCDRIMEDPVIVSSGKTYDRTCIQIWRDAGFSLCPITKQPLSDGNIIRNVALVEMISSWWNTSPPPSSFVCPLCNRVMKDPVVTTSGQTYDRACLQDAVCTEEYLAPNLDLKDLISCWLHVPASHGCALDSEFSSISHPSHRLKTPMTSSPARMTEYSWRSTDSCAATEPVAHYVNPSSGTPQYNVDYDAPRLSKYSSVVSKFSGNVDHISDGSASHTRSSLVSDGTFSSTEYSSWVDNADLDESLSELVRRREHREELRTTYKDGLLRDKADEGASSRIMNNSHVEHGNYSEDDHYHHISNINTLVSTLQSEDIYKQRKSAEVLRIMSRTNADRTLIANAGAVAPLIALLQANDELTQSYATTTLLNLSLDKDVRSLIIQKGAIMELVKVVKHGLTAEAKGNAAIALSSIWGDGSVDIKITSSEAIPHLVELLYTGSKSNKKDAASALYRLSTVDENKNKMIRSGICRCLLNFISDNDGMVEKAITLLRNLVAVEEGRVAFVADDGISVVFNIIKKGSRISKACGVSIFLQICKHSRKHKALLLKKDPLYALSSLLETARENRKAEVFLDAITSKGNYNKIVMKLELTLEIYNQIRGLFVQALIINMPLYHRNSYRLFAV